MKAQIKIFKLNREVKASIYISDNIEGQKCNIGFETATSEFSVWVGREDLEQLALKIKEALAGK